MTLKERISADYMAAFKAKDTASKNLLSVIKGEIQTAEKNTGVESMPDEEVAKILNKTAKGLSESISKMKSIAGQEENIAQASAELAILQSYLPKLMSREEIVKKVSEMKESGIVNIGQIMKEFAGLPVDRKVVSEVIKEVIG
jgi:uncharacterized protein YqeY